MLYIKNLHISINKKIILKGINLNILPGEIHVIMGPNGTGKSTLTAVLSGKDGYKINCGSIIFSEKDLLNMKVEDRARAGLILSFQYPVEIPGVKNIYLLRAALNAKRIAYGKKEISIANFMKLINENLAFMNMDSSFLHRCVNENFSGGEKKINEMFQMLILKPKLALLDEIDSGLDIDALKIVANGINSLRTNNKSILLVTHYKRVLEYVEPDYIHILLNGRIAKSGDKMLASEIESHGYKSIISGVLS
ncbi:Iron-sulfur cluster assembly ATPase protein SufC [Candidatus Johnevansia muelleri]|uniref:Iron-sulfur cluster assembly ATPase protein SufC n=1 Tax=Candidatus Johnevansia muelleri TaxID=1495769 RepID=A0A078KH85_9GAMM|nr:Iron-sulfur cluster assembly ATPase protein SufC [Candidatus Evansia muelleri]